MHQQVWVSIQKRPFKERINEAKGQILPPVFKDFSIKMQACKPGSVPSRRMAVAIYLGSSSQNCSIDLPFLRS
jgi:hypothetical protein